MRFCLAFRRLSSGVRVALLLWLVLTFCLAEIAEPLLLLFPVAAGLLTAFLYPLLYAIAGEKSIKARRAIVLAGLSILGSGLAQFPIMRLQTALTRQRREATVAALEQYRQQHQHYPEFLGQLVPAYLAHLPRTGHGVFSYRSFDYHVSTDSVVRQTYWLSYYSGALVEVSYNSRSRRWIADD